MGYCPQHDALLDRRAFVLSTMHMQESSQIALNRTRKSWVVRRVEIKLIFAWRMCVHVSLPSDPYLVHIVLMLLALRVYRVRRSDFISSLSHQRLILALASMLWSSFFLDCILMPLSPINLVALVLLYFSYIHAVLSGHMPATLTEAADMVWQQIT